MHQTHFLESQMVNLGPLLLTEEKMKMVEAMMKMMIKWGKAVVAPLLMPQMVISISCQ
jgi:hypothetical protein